MIEPMSQNCGRQDASNARYHFPTIRCPSTALATIFLQFHGVHRLFLCLERYIMSIHRPSHNSLTISWSTSLVLMLRTIHNILFRFLKQRLTFCISNLISMHQLKSPIELYTTLNDGFSTR